jgi:hypothetical protein
MKEKYLTLSVLLAIPEHVAENDPELEIVTTILEDAVKRAMVVLEGRIVNENVNVNWN